MARSAKPISKEFLEAYLRAALWTSVDKNDKPMDDKYDTGDFTKEARARAVAECNAFITANMKDLVATGADEGQHGHDFWLTRNGHGVGFWDRGYPKALGERLSASAKAFGERYVYEAGRGKVAFE